MNKKINIITIFLILAIIVGSIAAIASINSRTVGSVSKCDVSKSASNSVTVKWEEAKKADGYNIYMYNNASKQYDKVDSTKADVLSYKVENLDSATSYKLRITAYIMHRDEMYESKTPFDLDVYTIPSTPTVKLASAKEGLLTIKWDSLTNVKGYEVEYSKNKDFSDSKNQTLTADKSELTVEKLTPEDTYYARVRGYFVPVEDNVYGDWSKTQSIQITKAYVMSSNIDPKKPIVALSFDDGPAFAGNANSTETILKVLEEHGARATFFMCGSRINNSNKYLLKKEIELGCEIGNHTYDHSHYGHQVTAADISKSSNAIKAACGQAPTIFRCPGGMMSSTIQAECKKEGMPIAYWSVDTEDWKSKNPSSIYSIATKYVYDGSIILMHDIYPTTAEAVKKIVPKLIADGYQVVTVSEMLAVKTGKNPQAGQQYIDYKTINNNT